MEKRVGSTKFDIRYALYGRGEPRVALVKPGTMSNGESIAL
ncbi:MAG: hypothetical protein ACE5HL_05895 [Terriglobia bacterium]